MSGAEQVKRCTKCSVVKPLEEFHRDKGGKHGRRARCKACVAGYGRANRERGTERVRAWRAANPERDQENRRRYHGENRDRLNEQRRKHRAENPHGDWQSDYRKRSRAAGCIPIVRSFTRADVIARWGATCWHCPDGEFEELDHFPVSVIDGGEHTLENVRPSCKRSNIQGIRGAKLRRGLLAEQEQIEATNLALLEELRNLATV